MKLQMNKNVDIAEIAGASVPDAVAKIGSLRLEADGSLTYAIHFYPTVEDADEDENIITFQTFNMIIPNLENQIIINVKTKQGFESAVEL